MNTKFKYLITVMLAGLFVMVLAGSAIAAMEQPIGEGSYYGKPFTAILTITSLVCPPNNANCGLEGYYATVATAECPKGELVSYSIVQDDIGVDIEQINEQFLLGFSLPVSYAEPWLPVECFQPGDYSVYGDYWVSIIRVKKVIKTGDIVKATVVVQVSD